MSYGKVFGSTGFFRVARTQQGRWLLLDPHDRPFQYRGVCAVNRAGTPGGRRAVPGEYADVVDRKYGYKQSPRRFVQATIERLREWGFNAFGAWTTEEFFDQGMPYVEIVEFNKAGVNPLAAASLKAPDVFDPRWIEACDMAAGRLCTPRRDSTELVGYFTDNELGYAQPNTDAMWGADELVNTKGPTLLQACMALDEATPARSAAWEFALARHGSFDALSREWGLEQKSPQALAEFTAAGGQLTSIGYGRDQDDFSRLYARRYVEITSDAIHRHDPNHLILGARFGAPPGEPILSQFVRPHVDFVSAYIYRVNMYDRVEQNCHKRLMPVLNGEFAWASPPFVDPQHISAELAALPLEQRLERTGPPALERAFEHPNLVGYTWYRWVSNYVEGKAGYGLVSRAGDEPCQPNVRLITQANESLERAFTAWSG